MHAPNEREICSAVFADFAHRIYPYRVMVLP
jgi:hypothetical protein